MISSNDQGSNSHITNEDSTKCQRQTGSNSQNSEIEGCSYTESGQIPLKISFGNIESLNNTNYIIDRDMSSKDPLTDKDYFLEWRPKKTSSQTQGIDDLNIQDEIIKNNNKIYNEFTPHFDTYLKRQQSFLLTNTICK